MRRLYLAELRDSWPAWLGVSLAFVMANLSFANSALVLASGWEAVSSGRLALEASAEFTLSPVTNFLFSGAVSLVVIATSASMVIDSRRGSLARLALAGASPGQVTRSVMVQLVVAALACAVIADGIALATLDPYLAFLTFGTESGLAIEKPAPVHDLGSVLLANLGVVAVAVVGGYGQARRAAAITPVEALRQAAAAPPPRVGVLRWIGVALALAVVGAFFAAIPVVAGFAGKETASTFLQMSLGTLVVFIVAVATAAPALVSPLARAWTALIPSRSPVWQMARRNVYVRGARFARSVVPIIFTIGLMLGLLSLGPTIHATSVASGFEEAISLDKAGMGAFLSLLGPALAIALAGGVGNLFMMSKQRDAELALFGIAGATPNQRLLLPALEAVILTVTAAIPAVAGLGVMLTFLLVSLGAGGLVPAVAVPTSAWLVGIGGTGLVMVAATFLPTLGALRLPEPRVVARLAAE
ncbi:MAG: hypothetical protein Q4F65_00615 [Propionibacteriaceae bacterium]|nr:hypothetical protein [Propionibacteriaceae bacterium]